MEEPAPKQNETHAQRRSRTNPGLLPGAVSSTPPRGPGCEAARCRKGPCPAPLGRPTPPEDPRRQRQPEPAELGTARGRVAAARGGRHSLAAGLDRWGGCQPGQPVRTTAQDRCEITGPTQVERTRVVGAPCGAARRGCAGESTTVHEARLPVAGVRLGLPLGCFEGGRQRLRRGLHLHPQPLNAGARSSRRSSSMRSTTEATASSSGCMRGHAA